MDLGLVAAARPWTYWIAPALVVAGVWAVVGMTYGYCRQVLEPRYRMLDQRRHGQLASTTTDVTRLAGGRGSSRRPASPPLAA